MASAGTVTLNLDANSVRMIRELQKAQRKTKQTATRMQRDMNKSFKSIGRSADVMGKVVAAAIGIAVVRSIGKAVTASRELEVAWAEVSTLMDDTRGMDALSVAVNKMAVEFGEVPVEQVKALYDIISAGAKTAADRIEQLTVANKLAIGGVTDLKTAADGLTSVLNAYEDSGISATRVSDIMFETMRRGKTTIGQLSESIGNVATIAAQVGVSFEELGASIATVTVAGIKPSQAIDGFRGVLNALLKQSEQTQKSARDIGIQFDLARIKQVGFLGVLRDIANAKPTEEQLAKLIGRVEGLTNILAIAKNGGEKFIDNLDGIKNSAGATDIAVEKLATTADREFKRLTATLAVESAKSGDAIMTILLPAIVRLRKELDGISSIFDPALWNTLFATGGGSARPDAQLRLRKKEIDELNETLERWKFGTMSRFVMQRKIPTLELEIRVKTESYQKDVDEYKENIRKALEGARVDPLSTQEITPLRTPKVRFDFAGLREAIAIADKLEANVDKILANIEKDIAEFGMTDEQKVLFNLIDSVATEEQIAQIKIAQDELRVLNEIQAAAEDAADSRNDLEQEYADLIVSTLTAAESHHAQISRIDQLWAQGVIPSVEEYIDLLERVNDSFEGTQAGFDELTQFADQAARNMQDAFADFLFDPFEDGVKGMAISFARTIQRMAADLAAQQILGAIFSSFGVSSGVSKLLDAPGMFAGGGSFSGGSPMIVGERGPELIVPSGSGTVIPNNQLGGNNVVVNIDARQNANPAEILALIPTITAHVKESIAQSSRRGY